MAARKRVQLDCSNDVPRTKQSMRDECNINNIMAKYQRTGTISHINKYEGQYGDFPAIDYRQALETVKQAEAMFNDLPARARMKFNNDPAQFLEYVQDPKNLDEMRETGLAKPKPKTPPADPATPPSSEPDPALPVG